ncbi:MAG: HD domain-containing protein, partial [Planctomycetes bacterium]|nr:HD domain-containing protein [Planctomycetota bacterium]
MDATRTVGIDFSDPAVMADVLTSAIDNAPIAYAILDEAMRVHFVNEYFLKLRHIRRGDILGNYCYNVINEGKPCSVCSVRQALAAGRPEMVKRKDIHDNGTVSYLDDFAIPILNDDGRVEYVLEMMVDRSGEMQVLNTNEKVFLGIVRTLTSMLDMKDRYTSSHSNDVTEITVKLATYMGIGGRELDDLRLASLLHDLGKIVVPDEIISKPTKLSDEEYKIIQQHPVETFNMLSRLRQFQTIGFLAGSHHERWDGNGYPNRLKGDEIPFGARILAVADTYVAMTSDRPYRKALQHGRAV